MSDFLSRHIMINLMKCITEDGMMHELTVKEEGVDWIKTIAIAIGEETLLSEKSVKIILYTYKEGKALKYINDELVIFEIMEKFKEDFNQAEAIKIVFVDPVSFEKSRRVIIVRK